MQKLISFLKGIRLGQILTICLVGLLVFVGTAFGSSSGLQAQAQTAGQIKEEVPETGATSPYEGGMNEFSDIDPRQDTSEADTKARFLVDKAERNVTERSIDSPGEFVENFRQGTPLGERVQNLTKSVSGAAKGAAEDVSKNFNDNTQGLSRSAR